MEEQARPQAGNGGGPSAAADLRDRYLDLLERSLTRTLHHDDGSLRSRTGSRERFLPEDREDGLDWPERAETMVGVRRLRNVRDLLERAIREDVPGDVIETGVWRGGVTIYMRAILAAHGITDRRVWVADSFKGLPRPDAESYPADAGDRHHALPELSVSRDEVEANFARYGLMDGQVVFLPGWFRETLPTAPITRLALLRLDGDLYESTIVALRALYSRLSPGGFVIVDDHSLPGCRQAVTDFRRDEGIEAPLEAIGWYAAWWRRP